MDLRLSSKITLFRSSEARIYISIIVWFFLHEGIPRIGTNNEVVKVGSDLILVKVDTPTEVSAHITQAIR